jgi:hypothetical protein
MFFGTGEPVGALVPEISDCAQLGELAMSSVQANAGSDRWNGSTLRCIRVS